MIPKIIHYCWFGGGAHSEQMKLCMASWQKYCPDFEIKEWNESNSPVDMPYLAKALANEKWANASNLVRLWAAYNEGGLYFDTDVEVLKKMDVFLSDRCFFGWQDRKAWEAINNAVFGTMPGHPFIKDLKEALLEQFDGTEKANLSSPSLVTNLLLKKGLQLRRSKSLFSFGKEYRTVQFGDVTIYARKYFYPYAWHEQFHPECIKKKTYCIHHWSMSWRDSTWISKRIVGSTS